MVTEVMQLPKLQALVYDNPPLEEGAGKAMLGVWQLPLDFASPASSSEHTSLHGHSFAFHLSSHFVWIEVYDTLCRISSRQIVA